MTDPARMAEAVDRIRRAIDDEGPDPVRHRRIMAKHRREWPTLWAALDELLDPRSDHRARHRFQLDRYSTYQVPGDPPGTVRGSHYCAKCGERPEHELHRLP